MVIQAASTRRQTGVKAFNDFILKETWKFCQPSRCYIIYLHLSNIVIRSFVPVVDNYVCSWMLVIFTYVLHRIRFRIDYFPWSQANVVPGIVRSRLHEEKLRCSTWRLKPKHLLLNFCATQPFSQILRLLLNFGNLYVILPARSLLAMRLLKLENSFVVAEVVAPGL